MKPERTKEEILKDITFFIVDMHGESHSVIYPDDALNAMEEYRQSSPVESKWVSVDERLPEHGQIVVVRRHAPSWPCIVKYKKDHGHPFLMAYGPDLPLNDVTHWMELPPIEETKEK